MRNTLLCPADAKRVGLVDVVLCVVLRRDALDLGLLAGPWSALVRLAESIDSHVVIPTLLLGEVHGILLRTEVHASTLHVVRPVQVVRRCSTLHLI